MPDQNENTPFATDPADTLQAAGPLPVVPTVKPECDELRAALLVLENRCRRIKEHPALAGAEAFPGQRGEMIAQSMLAVRAIEDARMRVGKVLQYARDGVSIFDQPPAPFTK